MTGTVSIVVVAGMVGVVTMALVTVTLAVPLTVSLLGRMALGEHRVRA